MYSNLHSKNSVFITSHGSSNMRLSYTWLVSLHQRWFSSCHYFCSIQSCWSYRMCCFLHISKYPDGHNRDKICKVDVQNVYSLFMLKYIFFIVLKLQFSKYISKLIHPFYSTYLGFFMVSRLSCLYQTSVSQHHSHSQIRLWCFLGLPWGQRSSIIY